MVSVEAEVGVDKIALDIRGMVTYLTHAEAQTVVLFLSHALKASPGIQAANNMRGRLENTYLRRVA